MPGLRLWATVSETLCQLCQAPVIVARTPAGRTGYKRIVIESCTEGEGRIAMFLTLFADPGLPLAEEVSNGTAYRMHHCGGQAFTARARERKQR